MARRLGWAVFPAFFCLLVAVAELAADPLTVVLVLDTSGSIKNQDLTQVRNLAPDLLSNLPPASEIAIFTFDDEERLLVPRTADVVGLERSLTSLSIGGSRTVLNDALYAAGKYLHEQPGGRKALILITDGKDTGSTLVLDDALKLAGEADFPILTVSVGKADLRTLRRIALLTEGRHLSLPEASGYSLAKSLEEVLPAPVAETPVAATQEVSERDTSSEATSSPGPSRPDNVLVYAGTGVLVALLVSGFGVLAYSVWRRRRVVPLCPGCGSPLPAGGSCSQCTQVIQPQPPISVPAPNDALPTFAPPGAEVRPGPTLRVDRSSLGTLRVRRGRLLIENGQGAGNVFDVGLGATVLVGRSQEAQVQLGDLSVSQRHCQLRADVDGFFLQDLGSLNGTFVNGKATTEHSLKDGDMIQLGETTLRFRLG